MQKNLNKYFIFSDKHTDLPKMQTFTKKFITFEQNEIFECFKKHCKVQEAYFYGKNHELDGNKRNAWVWGVNSRFFERGKMQTFTKKFITFKQSK